MHSYMHQTHHGPSVAFERIERLPLKKRSGAESIHQAECGRISHELAVDNSKRFKVEKSCNNNIELDASASAFVDQDGDGNKNLQVATEARLSCTDKVEPPVSLADIREDQFQSITSDDLAPLTMPTNLLNSLSPSSHLENHDYDGYTWRLFHRIVQSRGDRNLSVNFQETVSDAICQVDDMPAYTYSSFDSHRSLLQPIDIVALSLCSQHSTVSECYDSCCSSPGEDREDDLAQDCSDSEFIFEMELGE